MFKQYRGLAADEECVKELISQESKLNAYEVILSKQKYLAGDMRPVSSFFERGTKKLLVLMEYFMQEVTLAESRTYSTRHIVASSLSASNWGIWRSVRMSRGR